MCFISLLSASPGYRDVKNAFLTYTPSLFIIFYIPLSLLLLRKQYNIECLLPFPSSSLLPLDSPISSHRSHSHLVSLHSSSILIHPYLLFFFPHSSSSILCHPSSLSSPSPQTKTQTQTSYLPLSPLFFRSPPSCILRGY